MFIIYIEILLWERISHWKEWLEPYQNAIILLILCKWAAKENEEGKVEWKVMTERERTSDVTWFLESIFSQRDQKHYGFTCLDAKSIVIRLTQYDWFDDAFILGDFTTSAMSELGKRLRINWAPSDVKQNCSFLPSDTVKLYWYRWSPKYICE